MSADFDKSCRHEPMSDMRRHKQISNIFHELHEQIDETRKWRGRPVTIIMSSSYVVEGAL